MNENGKNKERTNMIFPVCLNKNLMEHKFSQLVLEVSA
jgi:hypothetical protein